LINYEELLSKLIDIVREGIVFVRGLAGKEEYVRKVRKHEFSGDVTRRFDEEAEKFLLDRIKSLGIDSLIITEESGEMRFGSDPKLIYVIDPVDGSINFASNIPWSSISIAVAPYKEGALLDDITLGIIGNIYTGDIYYFIKGHGCFENGGKVVKRGPPQRVIFGYFESLDAYLIIPKYWSLRGKTKVRSLGCVSLDLVYVGLGRAECFIDVRARLRNVDVAAAYGFIKECGGEVSHADGTSLTDVSINRLDRVYSLIASWDRETHKYLVRAYELLQKDLR